MSRDKTARLRMDYTGEPYSAAFRWYRSRGLVNGLVPDAESPQQQVLEACVLRSLARPAPSGLPLLVSPGTAFGLEGVSPDVDTLFLRPAGDLVVQVLARILPSAAAAGVVGVPGLRAQVSRRSGLTVGRIGERAVIEVQPSRTESVQAAQEDLQEAAELVTAAGLTPLWSNTGLAEGESEAWYRLRGESADAALWSTALRRIGLFVAESPDWTRRGPAPEEVAGPRPARIRPRPVSPGSRVTGVVAVTSGSGRGGLGCTTAAVALAGALARSGAAVGMLAGQDDPNGVLSFRPKPRGTAPDGWCDLVAIDGGGTVRAAAVPQSADANEMIARARTMFDIVIIDAGHGGFPHRQWTAFADVTVALVPHEEGHWTGAQLVDSRPDRIRFFAWLDDAFNRFNRAGGRRMEPLEKLLAFLDEEFLFYVTGREADGDAAVYDASDPEDAEQWWSSYALADQIDPDEEDADEDDGLSLPTEEEAPFLDEWRADFLSFLAEEGARRHAAMWAQAAAQWAGRSKDRNLKRLWPGQGEGTEVAQEFAVAVEKDAIREWGLHVWQSQFPVWEAAREAGDDLLQPWARLLETIALPRDPKEIATHLRGHLRGLPGTPTVVALARAENRLGSDQLTAVRDVLMDDGFAGLVVLPELPVFSELPSNIGRVAERAGEAAAAANRLALVVTNTLREVSRTRGSRH
ncbi:hypothetical protein ACWERI_34360 [Streptomyces collinus]